MGDKATAQNFTRGRQQGSGRENESRYNTEGYYRQNRGLGNSRDRIDPRHDDEDQYDERVTGKEENYNAEGYYGSHYGAVNESNRGRNYERNAGYRASYEHLPTEQWPEVERAAKSRGFDLREYELAQRGVHRGKGPKGWQRSDQRIEEEINDMLTEDAYIDATEINAKVEKGDVILTGVVENRSIKRRVEDLVERVSGIRNIENRLRCRFTRGQTVNIQNS